MWFTNRLMLLNIVDGVNHKGEQQLLCNVSTEGNRYFFSVLSVHCVRCG